MNTRNLQVMDEFHLGPNGGLVYCMEFLSKNFEWLSDKIKSMLEEDKYLLIDCPGQVIFLTFSLIIWRPSTVFVRSNSTRTTTR